jgi:hypothetical protein
MRSAALTCLLVLCFVQKAETVHAQWNIPTVIPRWGYFEIEVAGGVFGTQIDFLTSDSDEALQTATAPLNLDSSNSFAIQTGSSSAPAFSQPAELVVPAAFGGPSGSVTPFSGATITQAPQNLDAANWAFAIGVRNGSVLTTFFQMRLAGSSATVLDSSLASQAVAAGLWSGVNDYFEFPSNHAGIGINNFPVNGPEDYYSYVVPEPASAWLLVMAGAGLLPRRRRP